ncbi:MAG: hypothetical protein QM725_15720 [Lacibacter sp.]
MAELTDDYLNGNWKGFLTRKIGKTEEEQVERTINFSLQLSSSAGEISGSLADEETSEIMNEPATFNGFIDEAFISFILQYPFYYSHNEEGELLYNEDAEHPPVHYSGEYIAEEECFRGIWEIEYYVHDVVEESQLFVETGNWEMKKQ